MKRAVFILLLGIYLLTFASCSGDATKCDVVPEISSNIIGNWQATTQWDNKSYNVSFNADNTLVGNNSNANGIFGPKSNRWSWDERFPNFIQLRNTTSSDNCSIISNECNLIKLEAYDGIITLTR